MNTPKPRRVAKITPDIVQEAKKLLVNHSQREVAKALKISQTSVFYINQGVYDDPFRQLPTTERASLMRDLYFANY